MKSLSSVESTKCQCAWCWQLRQRRQHPQRRALDTLVCPLAGSDGIGGRIVDFGTGDSIARV